MRHLGISGGGTKIAGLFGVAESIIYDRGYIPDIISGISAGAILALPLALGKREEIKKQVLNISMDDFFEVSPIKNNGKIKIGNAIKKIICGRHYLGDQKNLEITLAKTVSRAEFEAYKLDKNKAICIVGSVDFYTGKRFYINLKTVSYEHFLKFVNASASIPIFTPGITMDGPIYDFEGETILNGTQYTGIAVAKGNNDPLNKTKDDNEVDALAGATITGNGVSAMISETVKLYKPYLETIRAK